MIDNMLEVERKKLYDLIRNKASYEDILEQSHIVDVLVVKSIKATL